MKIRITPALTLFLMLTATTFAQAQQPESYTKYVNTFIGTAPLNDPKILGYTLPKGWRSWAGLVFPGSSVPNAMVQLSPITAFGSGAGYQYEDTVIYGFAHTNKGHWNLCNIPILPVSVQPAQPGKYGSRFSHDNESSSPGYYQVYLDDYHVNVRLTSTLRCGYHQYRYRDNVNRQILFDLSKANSHVNTWYIKQVDDYTVEGFQGGENVYFYARLNTKIVKLDTIDMGKHNGYAMLHLADGSNVPVELKIGLSFVSTANAKLNLDAEIGSKTFEEVREAAHNTWEALLSKIQVTGGDEKQKRMFYSCLYRSFLWPALRSDVNGEYTDAKGQIINGNFDYYTVPSLWDTYRNKDVLLELMAPIVAINEIKSMIDIGDKTGFIPTFFHGDHAASVIAGAYLRGIGDFDIKDAYRLLLRNANIAGGTRPYITEYIQKGYVSDPDVANPAVETKGRAGVSTTLEYAYDDYSVAQIAKKLGDTANYRTLMARSKNYKNVFDPSTHFMRGRLENGDWITPFNPQYPYYEYMYREANAWQVSFYVPQDIPGLIKLYGGPNNFEAKLDSLFTVPWNPDYIARNVETMVGQYCQGNQPDHEAPFSYIFIGKPEKSQKRLDYIMNNLYGIGDKGLELSGMDDAGEMSAWYVFTSLGLYPFSATDPRYIVTVPLFNQVKWKTSSGKLLVIAQSGKSRDMKAIKVNNKTLQGYFVPHELFKTGGIVSVLTR